MKILKETYPKTEILLGTHQPHDPVEKTRKAISQFLMQKMGRNIIP